MVRLNDGDDVKVRFSTEYDPSGAEQAKKGVKDVAETTNSTAEKMRAQAEKATEAMRMTWAEFNKGKMGPYMKEALAQGMEHAEAHTVAIRRIAAEWKAYKEAGVSANQSVSAAMEKSASTAAAMESAFFKGQSSTLEWERTAREANNAVASSFSSMSDSVAASSDKTQVWLNKLKSSWAELAALYLSSRWFIDAANDSLQAEKAFNQLRIQIEGMGIAYGSVAQETEAAVEASARYASMQDEDVAKVLQELEFHSGQYAGSLKYLNLTLDMSYQKHISTSEAALLVGKAMSGNVEMLGRIIPELRNLEEKLGKNATEAQKVAYAMGVLEEKANGALKQMTEHEKKVTELTNTYLDAKQAAGSFAVALGSELMETLKEPLELYRWLESEINSIAHAANANNVNSKGGSSAGGDNNGPKHGKSLAEMEAEARAESERFEREKQAKEAVKHLNKSLADETENLRLAYSKLTKTADEYFEVERKNLLAKGASKKAVDEYVSSLKALAEAQAQKETRDAELRGYQQVEDKILDIAKATAKLSEDKRELLTLEAQEAASLGATTEQVERFIVARQKQLELEQKLNEEEKKKREAEEAKRKQEQAQQTLLDLYKKNPYGDEARKPMQRLLPEDYKKEQQLQAEMAGMELAKYEELQAARARLRAYDGDSEIVNDHKKYQLKLQALEEYNAQVIMAMQAAGASETELKQAHAELQIAAEKKKRDFQMQYAADAFGAASNMMQNLYVATGSKNKAMFEAMKAFAIAETVIQTYQGAQQAYTAMSSIPWVGPALGIAAAAAAIAAGLARIQSIRNTSPGGANASISAGGSATPTYSGGSTSAYPVPEKTEQPKSEGRTINIYVQGNIVDQAAFAREIAPYVDEARGDKVSYGSAA